MSEVTEMEAVEARPPAPLKEIDDAVFAELKRYINNWGWAPSVRELAEIMGVGPNTIFNSLKKLEAHGFIESSGKPRCIRLVGAFIDMTEVPRGVR